MAFRAFDVSLLRASAELARRARPLIRLFRVYLRTLATVAAVDG